MGLTDELEVCVCYVDTTWNVQVKPIENEGDLWTVRADDAAMICRYITKNMRPGERLDVQCMEGA